MNVTSTQLDSMAASANNVVGVTMLRKAIDSNAGTMSQLLASLPQKDNAGRLVDVQA